MQIRSVLAGGLLVLSAFVLGCGESAAPTAVADLNGPRFNFTNGPNTANVFRFEDQVFDVIADFETDLILFVGLPADASDVFFCGGQSDFDLMPIQHVGQLEEAFKRLILGRDIHIHVYDLTTFDLTTFPTDICVDLPIAQGTGSFVFRDNDAPGVGPGANSLGLSIHGTLDDLVNGGKVRVTGVQQIVILPDDSFKELHASVRLHPIGQK